MVHDTGFKPGLSSNERSIVSSLWTADKQFSWGRPQSESVHEDFFQEDENERWSRWIFHDHFYTLNGKVGEICPWRPEWTQNTSN